MFIKIYIELCDYVVIYKYSFVVVSQYLHSIGKSPLNISSLILLGMDMF